MLRSDFFHFFLQNARILDYSFSFSNVALTWSAVRRLITEVSLSVVFFIYFRTLLCWVVCSITNYNSCNSRGKIKSDTIGIATELPWVPLPLVFDVRESFDFSIFLPISFPRWNFSTARITAVIPFFRYRLSMSCSVHDFLRSEIFEHSYFYFSFFLWTRWNLLSSLFPAPYISTLSIGAVTVSSVADLHSLSSTSSPPCSSPHACDGHSRKPHLTVPFSPPEWLWPYSFYDSKLYFYIFPVTCLFSSEQQWGRGVVEQCCCCR